MAGLKIARSLKVKGSKIAGTIVAQDIETL